jgi:hypothetical protein
MRSYARCLTTDDRTEKMAGNSVRKYGQQQKRKFVAGPKHHFILNKLH